jgi:hypothetical protein
VEVLYASCEAINKTSRSAYGEEDACQTGKTLASDWGDSCAEGFCLVACGAVYESIIKR